MLTINLAHLSELYRYYADDLRRVGELQRNLLRSATASGLTP